MSTRRTNYRLAAAQMNCVLADVACNLETHRRVIESARHRHSFLGIDALGGTAVVRTEGNPLGHLVLRGGADGPTIIPISCRRRQR